MAHIVKAHLDKEEGLILPAFLRYLSPSEQAHLIVRTTRAAIAVPHLPATYRLLSEQDLASLFHMLTQYCSEHDFKRIALAVADALSVDQWRLLCGQVPTLAKMVPPKNNALIEITHIHKAITHELNDIVSYCENVDLADSRQIQSLVARFNFLRRVHSYHAEGEESVLLKELHAKLSSSPNSAAASAVQAEHHDEDALFRDFETNLALLQSKAKLFQHDSSTLDKLKKELLTSVNEIASHLINHMDQEETSLLPLVRKYFSMEAQQKMMRRVMALVPSTFLSDVIPWMFNSLPIDDQESMLRNVLSTAPQEEIRKVVGTIAQSVQKGMIDRSEWNEICLRIPEIEENYNTMVDIDNNDEVGPVSEIVRVHKAFRIELNALLRRSKQLATDGTIPNPHTLVSLAESAAFLRKMVGDHSKAEDDILLPRLEKRAPGISAKYRDDHCDERKLFEDLAQCLEDLQCASSEQDCARLVKKLHVLARTLRDEMVSHLNQEEEQMWPLMKSLCTPEEQSEIVALIFGQMSSHRLRELLPWMIRMLSVSERNTMMNHILKVTQSTMFEKWLKTWLPLDEDKAIRASQPVRKENVQKESLPVPTQEPQAASTALALLNGRDSIERSIRAIARDSSLSVEARTRMMQQIMLAPYSQLRANAIEAQRRKRDREDDLAMTYTTDKNGNLRLGCKHYMRACKIRASCCGMLYTCRLCHDNAQQTHIMNRSATTEILCMRCGTLQGVSAKCINQECGKEFAKYFCPICVFYDDDESRSVYHCHSCNVCRVGKGLGMDYFHCMKCNQCMNMKYQDKGHVCIERAMESDCPVCYQYLFTSTSPIKYLRCGHLMHTSCYGKHSEQSMTCPVCSKSLDESASFYNMLDRQLASGDGMPAVYRSARCDIYCMDCLKTSNTPYHFMYNKCPKCSSYNTRVEFIDANAGDSSSHRSPDQRE